MASFQEALCRLYKNKDSIPNLSVPTVFYGNLTDICADSYDGLGRALILYKIDCRIGIVKSIFFDGGEVRDKYSEVSDLILEAEFDCVASLLLQVRAVDGDFAEIQKQNTALGGSAPPDVISSKKQHVGALKQGTHATFSQSPNATRPKQKQNKKRKRVGKKISKDTCDLLFGLSVIGAFIVSLISVVAVIFGWSSAIKTALAFISLGCWICTIVLLLTDK